MKYVLVTGGVVSGLGKGVTASSIGVLLQACGFRVTSIKIGIFPLRIEFSLFFFFFFLLINIWMDCNANYYGWLHFYVSELVWRRGCVCSFWADKVGWYEVEDLFALFEPIKSVETWPVWFNKTFYVLLCFCFWLWNYFVFILSLLSNICIEHSENTHSVHVFEYKKQVLSNNGYSTIA
jgi:hypothetical protein